MKNTEDKQTEETLPTSGKGSSATSCSVGLFQIKPLKWCVNETETSKTTTADGVNWSYNIHSEYDDDDDIWEHEINCYPKNTRLDSVMFDCLSMEKGIKYASDHYDRDVRQFLILPNSVLGGNPE